MELFDFISFILEFDGIIDSSIELQKPVVAFWPIVAAIASIASTAYSAIKSNKANKKNDKAIKAMENENRQDYLREYYRGALENESSKAYLKKLDQRMKRADKAADNALTAKGATHENALAVKQANNEVYSNAVADLISNEQSRKDNIRSGYKNQQNKILGAQMQQNSNEAATWSQLGEGIASAAGQLGSAYSDTNPLKKDK